MRGYGGRVGGHTNVLGGDRPDPEQISKTGRHPGLTD